MKRCVCEIKNKDGARGTGFFCNLLFNNIEIPSLITAYYVINERDLLSNEIIKIRLNEEVKIIKINENRILYSNKDYNITIIEIKSEDKIDHFLDIDEYIFKEYHNEIYYGHSIYCIQYIQNTQKKVSVSYGILNNIEDNDKIHPLCSTDIGSVGSPIFNLETNRVIGILTHGNGDKGYNIGSFLTKPINEFIRKIELQKKYNEYKSKAFSNLELISLGSFGKVYSGFDTINKKEICLKKINLEEMKLNYEKNELTDYLKDLNNEIKILKMLSNNRNSIKFYGTYDENNEKVIIMEKCDQNLKQFIKERGKGMQIGEIKSKFKELNQLFRIIQEEKIIHRDLKLENFLIKYTDKKKSEYVIKLCDYGI
jgi:V8-like Glu-specific endopeptidase